MTTKISIRFYKDHKVRAIWDEKQNQWWFSVLDIVGAINEQVDHERNRNYLNYFKAKLKKEQNEVVSDTTQLKLTAFHGRQWPFDPHLARYDIKETSEIMCGLEPNRQARIP